ncbi:MAG: transporter substrate-binding domain-containing protein [Bifidobacteriaceae bacterium]|jgi:ABC-type amino acid transport substrate-binding protein|nr:transporter substrate-binding domain-containing protein [Bifidobacteriaceae bacterium]
MKKPSIIIAAGLLVLALSACGTEADEPKKAEGTGKAAASTSSDPAVAALDGKLVFGTEGTYAPFSFHPEGGSDLTGYDIEVAQAVADKLGVTAEFQETTWDGIFAALDSGRFTAIANEVEITDERKGKYDLSEPYSVSWPVVITKADNTTIKAVADLKGKTAGQTAGSNWGAKTEGFGAKVETVPGFAEAVAAVEQGRIDFTINDALAAADYFKTTGNKNVKIAFEITDEKVYQGFALKKDSGLLPAIDAALAELKEEGKLAGIGEAYFGRDISE